MPKTLPFSSLLIGAIALATDLGADESAMEKLRARLKAAEQFGTECCQMLSIPASAFAPTSSGVSFWADTVYGYMDVHFETEAAMWAPVNLPTGAVLDYIDLYSYDTSATSDLCATLYAYAGPTLDGDPLSSLIIGSACSTGDEGPGYDAEEISGTIDNSVWFGNGAQYAVVLKSLIGSLLAFKSVTIWWHREVSPAPGTATFNDVPTSHPQFQFIESLVESGITVGCGGGNYCPDNPVTRGQMAVFLSKALGLYWPF